MAYNVPAIEQFVEDVNAAANAILEIRGDLFSTDRLWPVLDAAAVTAIRAKVAADLAAAKALVAALTVP